MAAKAKVTVIIPTYNRAGYIRESIDSVLAQTLKPFQLIVVDDGSDDDTGKVLDSYGDRIIKIGQRNRGKPAAINAALPLVEGDFIWIFDDDDVACENALERHVGFLRDNPEFGWSYSSYIRFHTDPATGERIVSRICRVRPFELDEYLMELLIEAFAGSPAFLVRTQVQKQAGLYNERLTRSQDYDMSIKWGMIAPGGRLEPDEPTYFHREHAGLRGSSGNLFNPEDDHHVWREFNRIMMLDLGNRLALRHFLPLHLRNREMTESLEARARIRRWTVYCRKGMWEEALQEIESISRLPLADPEIREEFGKWGGRILASHVSVSELYQDSATLNRFAEALATGCIREARRPIAKSLYYGVRGSLQAAAFNQAWQGARVGSTLCGNSLEWLKLVMNR